VGFYNNIKEVGTATLLNPDGTHTVIEPLNKKYFTEKEIAELIGTKDWKVSRPRSVRSKVFIYSEMEDEEVNIKASDKFNLMLSGNVIECEQSEVDFEF